jgi:ubiquinone/menaquinone biosynthesis C-methylase UbiE
MALEVHHQIPIHVQIAPAESLPYPDDHFDVVVSSLVFCSVTNQQQALAEIERVLRPDGVLWMVEHVRPQTPILAKLASIVTPYWRKVAFNCHLDRPTLEVLAQRGWRVDLLRRHGVFVKLKATR